MKKGKTCRSEQIFQSIQQGPLRPLLFFERGSYMYRPIVFIDMPAFMKAYQAIQKLKKPSAVSNRLFQSLKLEDQIYDEAALKVPRLKEDKSLGACRFSLILCGICSSAFIH